MAISVVVADGRSHASLLAAILVESSAGGHRNIGKGPVVVVAVKNARCAVAGDENVGPAVFVEVEGGYAEGVMTVRLVDMGFRGDILKCAIAAVVIQDVLRACQPTRAAHDRNAFPDTGWPITGGGRRSQIEIDIVRTDEIEIAVAIVIYERATRAPCFTGTRHPGLLSDFGEDGTIIAIEAVLAVVGDVKVFPAIVVVVPDAYALSPAGRPQASLLGHIGKRSVVVIAVEAVRRALAFGEALEFCSVHQEDVRPTVVFLIEDGNSVPGRLDDVFLGIESAKDVRGREAGLLGDVREICNGSGRSCSRFRLLCG